MDGSSTFYTGTAGWQIPKDFFEHASTTEPHLTRYGRLFNATEINTTFYRPHLAKTFERWAAMVPDGFRFAVKMHKGITHERRLSDVGSAQVFLDMVSALGEKLGPLLVQLPPSLAWSAEAEDFLSALREVHIGDVVLEARHSSWSLPEAVNALKVNAIAGVAADPALLYPDLRPSGHPDPVYFRLHGSPRVYWSAYTEDFLKALTHQVVGILKAGRKAWVIFDNTAAGAAPTDALRLKRQMEKLLSGNEGRAITVRPAV